jgi:hypothetical protein
MLSTSVNNSGSITNHDQPFLILQAAVSKGMTQAFQQHQHVNLPSDVPLINYLTTTLATIIRAERLSALPYIERAIFSEDGTPVAETSLSKNIMKATRRADAFLFISMYLAGEPWEHVVEKSGNSYGIAATFALSEDRPNTLLWYLAQNLPFVATGLENVAEELNLPKPVRLYTESTLKLLDDF